MSEIASIASAIFKRAGKSGRFVVAIAGPPGSGKSTLSEKLRELLPEGTAEIVPMDGFHYDDRVLGERGSLARKGSPETFDFAGFEALLKRIRAGEGDIAIPLFDRSMELSRAAAAILGPQVRFVLVEGNYLLLDEEPWSRLAGLIDFSVFLDVPEAVLETRLLARWHTHGFADEEARSKVTSNDLPNARRVSGRRRAADMVVGDGEEL